MTSDLPDDRSGSESLDGTDGAVAENNRTFTRPRWRLTCWLISTGKNVPQDIQASLVASLFGTLPVYMGGIINTIMVCALIAARMPKPEVIGWLLFEIVICLVRLAILIQSHRAAADGRRTLTDIYIVLGLLWASSIGYGCFISIISGDWVASTLACVSAAAMVGGMCFRNFGAPRYVAGMILLSLGPCTLAAPFSGEPILMLMMFQIPLYLFSITVAAFRLNGMMVSTMMAERENRYLARHDHLTGLLNRAGLMQEMTLRLSERDGASARWALFYVDLDGFKAINDRHGHSAGDELLAQVAQRLRKCFLPDAVAARIGGDEFVILCSIGERGAALLAAERLMLEISNADYEVGTGLERIGARIGASIGVALHPDHGGDVETLLHAADTALYRAKSEGGHRCWASEAGNQWAEDYRPVAPPVLPRRQGQAN